jgi:VanZ family protein
MVVLLVVIAYYPFHWSPPRTVDNEATRAADGSLQFGWMNYARTPDSPPWLPVVRASGTVEIRLEVNPRFAQGQGPMMMLAGDFTHSDFGIQQYQSYLMVWLNRPGSTINGEPPYAISDALAPGRWTHIDVILRQGDLRIEVDGAPRVSENFRPDALRNWGSGRIALGDEVQGGAPWQGQIRFARVRAPGYDIDYMVPGALTIPNSFLFLPDHLEPFPPSSQSQWLRTLLDMLSFLPVGFLIVLCRRAPMRRVFAALLIGMLAAVLAVGKFLFADRHTSLAVVVLQVAGGLVGALFATWWLARRRLRR